MSSIMIQKIMLLLFFICFVGSRMIEVLHMYQQNRYSNERLFKWLTWKQFLTKPNILEIIILADFLNWYIDLGYHLIIIIFILDLLFEQYKYKYRKIIKPLVYTKRVFRLIITLLILTIIFGIITLNNSLLMAGILLHLYGCLLWFIIMFAGIINLPIERYIQNKYMKDAKKVINSNDKLIKVGITGSYGKTSCKNIVNTILASQYYTLATPKSYNTINGISMNIRADLEPLHEVYICEMGADRVNDISDLMDFIKPQYAILTAIGKQHLNTFGNIDNIIKEKMQIVERLPSNGLAIINIDNEYIKEYKIKNNCQVISFAIDNKAMYRAINLEFSKLGTKFDLLINNKNAIKIETKLLGKHNIYNILAAIALSHQLNISLESIKQTVKKVDYIKHRLEVKEYSNYTLIDNAFNSNPVGSKESLAVMQRMDGYKIIITPGMIDLANEQEHYNYLFGTYMLKAVDEVILVGRNQTKSIYQGLKDSGFNMNKVMIVDHLVEGLEYINTLVKEDLIVLLENDLPDAFNQ